MPPDVLWWSVFDGAFQLQAEVRRSAEKYHAACVVCEQSKRTLTSIEQSRRSAADSAATAVSFSAEEQESLNAATNKVSASTLLSPF